MFLTPWLRSVRSRLASRRRSVTRRVVTRQLQNPRTEFLEDRTLLTTTVFLDFGAAFPMGGIATTVDGFKNIDGPGFMNLGTGSDLTGNAGLLANDPLTFAPLDYDFNGDMTVDAQDAMDLGDAVLTIARAAVDPLDIDVQLSAVTDVTQVPGILAANDPGGPSDDGFGEFDAYNFIVFATSTRFTGGSVGANTGLFGIAANSDLNGTGQNATDEATLTFSDNIFAATTGTPGTAQFNANLAHSIAYTALHEAGHTQALIHTDGATSGANERLLTRGDQIRFGSDTREVRNIYTRFPLELQGSIQLQSTFDVLANDPDIGRRDTDRDNVPDVAYVTGTGAHDIITLTSSGVNTVDVQVDAYDDAAHTGLIRSHSYTIDLTTDTEGEIRIDGSINDDDIIIDADIAATFNVLGHVGNDRVILRGQAVRAIQGLTFTGEDGDDSLLVDYTNGIALPDSGITFDAGDMGNDSIILTGGTVTDSDYVFTNATDGTIALDGRVITYTGLDPITDDMGVVNRTFTFSDLTETVTLEDNGTAGDGISRISSVSDDMVPVPLSETVDFSAPTGSLTVNMGDGDDTLNFVALDSLFAASLAVNGDDGDDEIDGSPLMQAAFLSGGDGNDTVTGSDFDDSLSGGTGDDELDGGMGTDTLVETADVNLTLTNTSLTGLGTDMLTSLEQAILTGGASGNMLDASAFTTGPVTLLGGDGDDQLLGGTSGDSLDGEAGDDTLNGNAGSDTLVAGDGSDSVLGGDDADMITVTFAGGTVDVDAGDGADLIEVRDSGADVMGTVTIDAGLGNDLILTVPLLNGTLSIDGNSPAPGPPVDLLTISLIGTGITDPPDSIVDNVNGGLMNGTGSVMSSTHGDITFTSIEALNVYAGPDLVFDADQAVPFGGDGKDTGGDVDDFRIIRNGTLGELSVDGLLFAIFPVDVVNSITVNGSTDDDLFEINETGGQLPFTILYNGQESGGDNDALRVIGTPGVDTGVYIPSATTNGDGTITLAGQTISFTGLEPVEVTGMASFTLQTSNSQDSINIDAGRNLANTADALVVSGTSGGIVFVELRVLGVVSLTVDLESADGALSNDTVTISNGALQFDPADSLADLTILAGQGNDTFEIQDSEFQLPAGGTLTFDGGVATDTIKVVAQNDAAETDVALTLQPAGADATLLSTAGGLALIQLLNFSGEIADLTGNATNNLINLAGWSVNNQQSTATVNGGTGDDTLIGFDDDTVWTITGADSGTATGIQFGSIDHLVGGSGNDVFTLQNPVVFSGTVTGGGGGGTDQLDLSDLNAAQTVTLTAVTASGFDGTSNAVGGGFFGIDDVLGGLSVSDALQGLDANSTWEVDGSNRYIEDAGGGTVTFDSFEELQGGNATDLFQISGTRSVDLLGGDGNDTFSFTLAFSQIVGQVDGESGTDTLDLAALTTARDITLTASNTNGFTGTDASITADFTGIDSIVGSFSSDDVIHGRPVDSRWDVNGPDQGAYTESATARVLGFSSIENLDGNAGVDTFDFSNQATLTGDLTGAGGFDVLIGDDLRASEIFVIDGANTGQFVAPAASIIGGIFSEVETLVGAAGQDSFQFANSGSLDGVIDGVGGPDTIVGDNDGNTFTVSSSDAGDLPEKLNESGLGTTGFINVENLTGGAGVDLFNVNALLVGNVDGRGANDNFLFGSAGVIGGTVFGGPGFDTLTGDDDGNLFNVTGNGALSATGRGTLVTKTSEFQDIETLSGGAGNDTFTFSRLGSIIGVVDGVAGNNTLVGDDDGNGFLVSSLNAGLLQSKMTAFSNIQNLEGGAADDTFNINATLDGNITAFVGDDTITVNASGTVGGNIDAGELADLIEISGHVVGNVDAGLQNDTIVLQNGAIIDGTIFGNTGDDLFTIRGVVTLGNDLMGDAGDDTFEFLDSGSINTAIDGGLGSDSITGDDDGNVFTITGPDSGSLPDKVPAGYTSIENLAGGSGVDIFNINADLSGNLSGLGGDDQFNIGVGQTVGGSIDGGDGNDTIIVADDADVTGTIAGGADDDTLVVDFSGATTRTLTYDGGTGNDLLQLTGTVMMGSTAYTVGPTADAGQIVTSVGGVPSQTIDFTGLEPVEDLMTLASLIINASLGADVINIVDSALAGQTEVNFNGAFELIHFANKTAVTVRGGAGNDTVNVNNPNPATGLMSLDVEGEAGNDTINVLVDHTGNLAGGADSDSFVFTNGVQLTGGIDGQADSDTLNVAASTSGLMFDLTASSGDGFSGTELSLMSGTFDGLDSIQSGSGTDELNGLDVASTWDLDGSNTYTDDSMRILAFSGVETLNGGMLADAFNVTGFQTAVVNGGDGADQLTLTANGSFLNGPFDGGSGTDTVSNAGLTAAQSVVLTANGATDGFDGTASAVLGGFQNVDALIGSGADTLTGMDVVAIWEIDGTNTYEDDPTNRMLDFSSFATLQGGILGDTFNVTGSQTANLSAGGGADLVTFQDGATLSGTIDGGAANDVVDYSAYVSSGVISTVGDFTSIEQIIGGTTLLDVIVGSSAADTFIVTSANEGTVNGMAFQAFENLDGRDGDDVLTLQAAGTLNGTIEGGNGTDSLTISRPGPLTVNITGPGITTASATANGIAGNEASSIAAGFNNVNSLTATGSDILNGANADATWSLGATSSYTVASQSATFAGFRTLNGGSLADTFAVGASLSHDLNGNAGDDQFTIAASATLSGDVTGGAGADTLGLGTLSVLAGDFDGGADADTVSSAASTAATTVTLTSGSATGYTGMVSAITGSFLNVDNLVGSSAAGDVLNGLDVDSAWMIDSTSNYSNLTDSVSFSSFETVHGGSQDDTFLITGAETVNLNGNGGDDSFSLLSDAAALTGSISGGAGANALSFSGLTTVSAGVTLTSNGGDGFSGTAGSLVSGGFTDIFTLTGGGGTSDGLTGQDVSSTWEVDPAGDTYRDDSTGRVLNVADFENLTGGTLDDSYTIDPFATLNGSISDLGGGDVVTIESDGLGAGGTVTGGISTGEDADVVSIEDDAMVGGLVDTGAGNDLIEVDYGGGVSRTLNLELGTGEDDLEFDGTDVTAVVDYTVGPGADDGTLVTTIGMQSQAVTFSGLSPAGSELLIDRQDGATINVNGSSGADVITVQDGLQNISFFTEVVFNGAFAPIQFQNKTRAVIHGLGNTDTINLNNPMTATGLSFMNVEGGDNNDVINIQSSHTGDLNGGGGNDAFVFSDGATVTGEMASAVDGGSGTDTLDVQAFTTSLNATLTANTGDGFTGTLPSVLPAMGGQFTGVDQISAGTGVDTLFGLSTTATWQLDGSDTYTDTATFQSLSFDGFEDLRGSNLADVFEISGTRQVNLDGFTGDDIFRFLAEDSVVDGTLSGDAGMDTLDFSALPGSAAVVVTLNASGFTDGFDGAVPAVTGGFFDVNRVDAGSSAADSLTGINAAGSWVVDDPGTYTASGRTLTFNDFEDLSGNNDIDTFLVDDGSFQLSGGNGNDSFNFSDGVAFTGTINGDDGDPADDGTMDSVNFGLSTSSVTIGLSQLSNIEIINGSIPGNDTIEGTDGNDVFEISGADSGTANGADFSGFGELDGGLGDDSFQFTADAGVLSGAIEGGAGADTLGFSGVSGNVMLDLSGAGGVDGFNGTESGGALAGFTNINTLEGGLGTGDTLTGLDLDSTWTLDTTSTYAATSSSVQFVLNSASAIENLVGQSRDDVFNVTGTQTANLTAGDGTDEVNLTAAAMLTGSVSTGADDDILRFGTGALIVGPVDAGADDDVLDFASSTTDVDLTLTFADASGGFAGNAPALITLTPTFASDSSDFNTGTTSLAFTAVGAGAPGNVISVTVDKADQGMAGLPTVNVAGSMITVTLNTNAGNESTADNVIAAVAADVSAAALIGVTLTSGVGTTDITTPADPVTNLMLSSGLDAVTGINSVTGGSGQNSLTGIGTASTWTIGSTNTYVEDSDPSNSLEFSGIGSAIGSTGVDSFAVNAPTSLNLSGGDNDDSFSVVGSASVTGSLNGDVGDDLFTFSGAALVPAALDGGADTDTVDFSASITAVSINLDTFTNVEMVSGTTISDTIIGSSGDDDFTVTGSNNSGTVVSGGTGGTTTFTSFENLAGADGSDSFAIDDTFGLAGTVDGGADTDTLDYSAYTTDIAVDLAAGTGTGLGGSITGVENVIGGAGNDALTGDAGDNSLSGLAGDDTLADGAGDDTLDGGADNDTYLLTPGSADVLTDATGIDVVDFSGASAGVTIDLDDATAQDVFGGNLVTLNGTVENFAGSAFDDDVTAGDTVQRSIAGGGGSDTFNTAANGTNVWTITANDAGSVTEAAQTVSFSSVENLSGGTGDDSFVFGDGFSISGTVNGGVGSDTLDYTAYMPGNSVSLNLAGTVSVEAAFGGAGSDTIQADNTATLFDVTGLNAGDAGALAFVDFENLTGGSADDTFQFGSTGALSGGIDGGAAASENEVVLSTDDDDVTLSSLSATTGFSGSILDESMMSVSTFANINSVAAGAAGTDTFNGLDATSAWTLNDAATDLYQSGGRSLTIDEFESYTGGNGADAFTLNGSQAVSLDGADGDDQFSFASGAAHTTQIQGGIGTDTIQFAGPAAEIITLSAVGTSGFSGTTGSVNLFANTDSVIGTGTDTLMGVAATVAAFDLSTLGNTYQAGGQTLSFSGVSQLVGADLADTFSVTGAHTVDISAGDGDDQIFLLTNSSDITGMIDGGDGANDLFDLSSLSAGRTVDSSVLTNVEVLIGTSGNDTLVGSAAGSLFQVTGMSNAGVLDGVLNFSSVETLQGGAGDDSFSVDDMLTIGAVTGSTGDDTLSFAGYSTARSVQLTTAVAGSGYTGSEASVSAFTGINTITASGQSGDELTGLNSNATFSLDGTPTYLSGTETLNLGAFEIFTGNTGQDQFLVSGTQTATANGGGGSDTLALADGAVLNGVFTGGSGTDTIDFSAYSSPLTLTLPGLGATDGFQVTAVGPLGMTAGDVEALTGGTSVDNLTGQATDSTWTLGATDTYTTSGRSLTLDEIEIRLGSSGVDTFTIQGDALDVAAHQVSGGSGNDTLTLNLSAGTSVTAGATLSIGGGNPDLDPTNRDTVNLNASELGDGARSITLAYQDAGLGSLDVDGLGSTIVLTGTESLNVTGDSAGDDTVTVVGTTVADDLTVTPNSSGAAVFLDGATDFVNPGLVGGGAGPDIVISGVSQSGLTVDGAGNSDQLLYDGSGSVTVTSATSGTITQGGVVDVNYVNVEGLTTAQAVAYVLDAQGDAGNGGADDFLVQLNGGGLVEVTVNMSQLLLADPGDIDGLVINGSTDDDTLTVDFGAGTPVASGLTFNGGAGADDLVTTGGTSGVYTPSATTTGDGVLTIDGSAITFTGLEPVTVSGLDDLTFTTPGNADVISVTSPGVGQNLVNGTSDGVAFESLQFSNVDDFVLDAATNDAGGVDAITLGDISGIFLSGFVISTGSGADTVDGAAVTAVDLTISTGDGNDIITGGLGNDTIFGGGGTDGIVQTVDGFQQLSDTGATGAGTDSLSGIEVATLNGGAGDDTIGATSFSGDLVINTGQGSNVANGGSGADLIFGGVGRDTLTGGGGSDSLFGGGASDLLDGGAGDDVLKGQGATSDSLTGGSGNDFLDGGTGVDFIVESSTGNITLNNTQLFANGTDNLAGVEKAILTAGDGNDLIDVTAFTISQGTFLYGGLGNDTIFGAEARDVIFGLEGNDSLVGNGGDDDLMGSAGRDTMAGGEGNDRLRGQGGSGDMLIGGVGDDILDGGAGNDRLIESGDVNFTLTDTQLTGAGTDTVIDTEFATLNGGSSGNVIDTSGTTTLIAAINGLGGADTITGGSPGELIDGGDGNDTINAGGGDDTIDAGAGDDQTDGQAGSDRLVVSANSNLVVTDSQSGGDGNDTFTGIELIELQGGIGDNVLDAGGATLPTIQNGGDGNDTLIAGTGADELDGGDGTDVTSVAGTNVVLTDASFNGTDTVVNIEVVSIVAGATDSLLDASSYTLGSVSLVGGTGNDTLLGGTGNDTFAGNEGDDSIVGGAGNDVATGGAGDDTLLGGTGSDVLNGNGGNDLLSGEDDNDLARGGTGNDTILGGAGSDTLEGEDGTDSIRGGAANDTIDGGRNNDTLFGDDGDDSIIGGLGEDGIAGGDGNDFLLGDFGNDTLIGQAGNDNVLGSAGADVVIGGDGDDLLRGNGGSDTLAGNAGDNTFVGLNSEIDENFSETDFPFLL